MSIGVLFDCDGVLVNSEEIGYSVLNGMLARAGLYYSREQYVELLSGLPYERFIGHLKNDYKALHGRDMSALFQDEMNARYQEALCSDLQPVGGVKNLLRNLKHAGIPFAVASNGDRVHLHENLRRAGLHDFFTHRIFSRDDVCRPKPDPELYLLAASQIGNGLPRHYVVVEDSMTGVRAGVAAGMYVVGFIGENHRLDHEAEYLMDAGAHDIAFDMDQVEQKIFQRFGLAPRPASRPASTMGKPGSSRL